MRGLARAVQSCQVITGMGTILRCRNSATGTIPRGINVFSRIGFTSSSSEVPHRGLENMTVSEVLMTKGEEKTGSWLWCRTNDTVQDAVKNVRMTFQICFITT